MKGDVKRHFSPDDWKTKGSLNIQPGLCSVGILSTSFVPWWFINVSPASFRIRGCASKTLVVMATGWFYRRLDAYSFFRLSEGA